MSDGTRFDEILSLLAKHGVQSILIGGLAGIAHGAGIECFLHCGGDRDGLARASHWSDSPC